MQSIKNLTLWHLSFWQKIELMLMGHVFLREEWRKGWSGPLKIFLVMCRKHGPFEDYLHGFPMPGHFTCPRCQEER